MKDFVTYEQALELKELGLDELCFKVYDTMGYVQDEQTMLNMRLDYCSAPTFSQAFRWFRENHGLYQFISKEHLGFTYALLDEIYNFHIIHFNTYEEAELACLMKLIEIVKTKQL